MSGSKERIVIKGNEFYEIDLECEKRKREGKQCEGERGKNRGIQEKKIKK